MTPTRVTNEGARIWPLARKTDFFPKTGKGILDAAYKLLYISKIDGSCRPEPRDAYRALKSLRLWGTCKKDDNPVLITCTKEKVGILGSGLMKQKMVAGVRFELTTFGL
jgi:hypothetical protein